MPKGAKIPRAQSEGRLRKQESSGSQAGRLGHPGCVVSLAYFALVSPNSRVRRVSGDGGGTPKSISPKAAPGGVEKLWRTLSAKGKWLSAELHARPPWVFICHKIK